MNFIQRIKLHNFRRFPTFEADLNPQLNIFVGDNESGKSSILLAIDLTLSGNRSRVESIGLENLFHKNAIMTFLDSNRSTAALPHLEIELYLNEQNNPDLNGTNNSDGRNCDGLLLRCEPDDQYLMEIAEVLQEDPPNFPFEYYDINFNTFSGKAYNPYNKPLRHLHIDSAQINNEYATREYIKDLYTANVVGAEKHRHKNRYRKLKEDFRSDVLLDLNSRIDSYDFVLRTSGRASLETDLTIEESGITIENRGRGRQCFIKTEFALSRSESSTPISILLLEEPENHLSHLNMRRLVDSIKDRSQKQVIIATHSNLISSRLDLRKCILLNSNSTEPVRLNDLSQGTAEFFMKAPDNGVLEFILSTRVILVEGDAEYILAERFFQRQAGTPSYEAGVHIISVGGTSFKRYLELAALLNIKTAVVRDNDGNYQQNCVDSYSDFTSDNIKIFADEDDSRHTFEISLYECNQEICQEVFRRARRTLSVQEFMLGNKTEAAFDLLRSKGDEIVSPHYITDAIEWIRE